MKHVLLAAVLTLYPSILATMGVPKAAYDNLPPAHPLLVRGAECAADAVDVASLLPSETARETWARVIFVWANREGGCYADPKGNADDGRSCGVLQVQEPQRVIDGATCAKVKADRKLGMRVGLALMLTLAKRCGSIGAGLNVYSTGRDCKMGGAKPDAPIPLVLERLKLAGVDSSAPYSPGA